MSLEVKVLSRYFFHGTTPNLPRTYTPASTHLHHTSTRLHQISTELHQTCHGPTPAWSYGRSPRLQNSIARDGRISRKLHSVWTLQLPSCWISTELHSE